MRYFFRKKTIAKKSSLNDHGDLRIAHFVGMHALQVLPFVGFWLLKKPAEIIALASVYALLGVYLFVRALGGKPLFW